MVIRPQKPATIAGPTSRRIAGGGADDEFTRAILTPTFYPG
jgi:hypothetical protein